MDLLKPAVDWSGGNWAERIDQCASMLFCHGYIPLSQRDKIAAKLTRQFEAATKEAGWVRKAPASVDTRPKDEDATQIAASLASGAVPPVEAADAQPTPAQISPRK